MNDGDVGLVLDVPCHELMILAAANAPRVFVCQDVESLVCAAAFRRDEIASIFRRCHKPLNAAVNTCKLDLVCPFALVRQAAFHFSGYSKA